MLIKSPLVSTTTLALMSLRVRVLKGLWSTKATMIFACCSALSSETNSTPSSCSVDGNLLIFGSTANTLPTLAAANFETMSTAGLSRKSSMSALKAKPKQTITGFLN